MFNFQGQNDPLYIVYVPNVFKFTKISAKGTQKSLKWYGRAQKKNVEGDQT